MTLLEEVIKKVAGKMIQTINFEAEVISVDQETDTCVVQEDDGDKIEGVKLKSITSAADSKFILYPKVGSYVTCSVLQNLSTECYVTQYGEIDKVIWNCEEIVINGGDNGGVVKWPDTKTELDKAKDFINAVKQACSTPITEPGNGAPSAFQAALSAALTNIQVPSFDGLEDTKLKH